VIPDTEEGWALLALFGCENQPTIKRGNEILVEHDQQVDQAIVKLIDELAHVRFSAPGLVQMTLEETRMPTYEEQMDAWQALEKQEDAG
jgi:hypothetical protein